MKTTEQDLLLFNLPLRWTEKKVEFREARRLGQAHSASNRLGMKLTFFQAILLFLRHPRLRSKEHRDEREKERMRSRGSGRASRKLKRQSLGCDVAPVMGSSRRARGQAHHPQGGGSTQTWAQRLVCQWAPWRGRAWGCSYLLACPSSLLLLVWVLYFAWLSLWDWSLQ